VEYPTAETKQGKIKSVRLDKLGQWMEQETTFCETSNACHGTDSISVSKFVCFYTDKPTFFHAL